MDVDQPRWRTKNEIDYFISSSRKILNGIPVLILNSFNTASDHRMVGTTVVLDKIVGKDIQGKLKQVYN